MECEKCKSQMMAADEYKSSDIAINAAKLIGPSFGVGTGVFLLASFILPPVGMALGVGAGFFVGLLGVSGTPMRKTYRCEQCGNVQIELGDALFPAGGEPFGGGGE